MGATDDDAFASNAFSGSRDTLEQRYRQLLDHSPNPMCVHADGCVVYVNPAGLRSIEAQHASQVVGRPITDFVDADSIVPMLTRIAALQRDGDSSEPSEAVMLRLDGSPVDAEVISVLTRWDGKPAYQVVFRDLTMEKAAQAALRYQAALVTHATDAIIATTLSGIVTSWNRAAEVIYGRPASQVLTAPISDAVGAVVDTPGIIAAGGVEHASHRAVDGRALSVRVAAAAMDDGYVLVCSDHSALRRAERRFRTVVNSLDEGIMIVDDRGRPESINPAAREILGLPAGTLSPGFAGRFATAPLYDTAGNLLGDGKGMAEKTLRNGDFVRDRIVGYDRPDGTRRWLSVNYRPLDDDAGGGKPSVLASFIDVTEQRNAQLRLLHEARHDALTGLPNRAYVEAQAEQALTATPPTLSAVMYIDLDNIKNVNDELGHHAGDAVITIAAERLRAGLRAEDFIARHGGDEFVALLFGPTDRTDLETLTERLHETLGEPLRVNGIERALTASIGVAEVRPADPRNAAQLLQDADAAMYKAKVYRASTHFVDDAF